MDPGGSGLSVQWFVDFFVFSDDDLLRRNQLVIMEVLERPL